MKTTGDSRDDGVIVREAERADCPGILEIYNDAVLKTTASYDEAPRSLEHRQGWFDDHQKAGLPVFVAADGPGRIVGWSALNRYHERAGYRFTLENSVYVAEDWRGRGLGARLLAPLLDRARRDGFHAILAVIDADNAASLRLHARHGFEQVGLFREVGFKFGRWLNVVYMERLLSRDDVAK